MSNAPRTITVEIDPELHGGKEPRDEGQRLVWETLDTAWNLLREGAVRAALAEIRAQLEEQGFTEMPTDEELFAKANETGADPDLPKTYMDLAVQLGNGPAVELAEQGLYGAFTVLAEQTMADAIVGLGLAEEAE